MNTSGSIVAFSAAFLLLTSGITASADTFGVRVPRVETSAPIETTVPVRNQTQVTYRVPTTPRGPMDRKTFAGSFCKPDRGADTHQVVYSTGAIKAQDNQFAVVVCPIVRDNTVNTDGFIVTLYVKNVSDSHVACTLYSRNPYGDVMASQTRHTEEWGRTTLQFDLGQSVEDGYANLLCNLIDGDKLYSYTVGEVLDTGVDG